MASYNQQMNKPRHAKASKGYATWAEPLGTAQSYPQQANNGHGGQSNSSQPAVSMASVGPKDGGVKAPPHKKAKRDPASFTLDLTKPMKSQLVEFCQLQAFSNPVYNTTPGDPNAEATLNTGWKSILTVNGFDYTHDNIEASKKVAEQRAAENYFRATGLLAQDQEQVKTDVPLHPKQKIEMFLSKMNLGPRPTYQVTDTPDGFYATCHFQEHAIQSSRPAPSRKAAEHLAAEAAYLTLKDLYKDAGVQCVSAQGQGYTMIESVSNPKVRVTLNEYCMKRGLPSPKYESETLSVDNKPAFKGTVSINGQTYSTGEGTLYKTKKLAEAAAGEVAWSVLQVEDGRKTAEEQSLKGAPYKALLREHMIKAGFKEKPQFVFESMPGFGYLGELTFGGKTFKSPTPYLDKKACEQELAKLALEGSGINLAEAIERRALKAKRVLTGGL